MTNKDVANKISLRLNKSYSVDYNELMLHTIEEAINKAVDDTVRNLIKGQSSGRDGDEETSVRVDDLAILLKSLSLPSIKSSLFNEVVIPKDYRYFKRLTPIASKNSCKNIRMTSTFIEEANVDKYLSDYNSQPSFDFEESFHTEVGDKFRIYHNNDFEIESVNLMYYRDPVFIQFNPTTEGYKWEFNEDVCEMIVDEAVKIIAGDTENMLAYQLSDKRLQDLK